MEVWTNSYLKTLKDDINKETTVMGLTHGPRGFQRLSDPTETKR
jgi:hypothetical protein